jgi:hypothetical protein
MRREYCTYFDHRYAARGIAMIRSLRRHEPGARVWVLCLDEEVYGLFEVLKEPGVRSVRLAEFERGDDSLIAARNDGRTMIEYYFTCTASLILFVMRTVPDAEWVTYLDGDLWFFASPQCVYDEIGDASVAIIPHRYPPGLEAEHKYGIYNVGWISFRRTPDGKKCLQWWRERCLEWCLDIVDEDNDRFADQRYLNRFPKLFTGVHVLKNPGVNLAPWNIAGYRVAHDGEGAIVDGHRLIFFHFHLLKRVGSRLFITSHGDYGAGVDRVTREHVYRPYLRELLKVERQVAPLIPKHSSQTIRQSMPRNSSKLTKVRQLRVEFARLASALLRGLTVWMPR